MSAARLFAVRILAALLLSIPTSVSFGDGIAERAHKLHFSSIVLDTHDDTTQRFFSKNFDLGKRNPDGHIDIPRMKEGGMNAIFFSIWIDGRTMGPPAIQKALDQLMAAQHKAAETLYKQQAAGGAPGDTPGGEPSAGAGQSGSSTGGAKEGEVIDAEVVDEGKQ